MTEDTRALLEAMWLGSESRTAGPGVLPLGEIFNFDRAQTLVDSLDSSAALVEFFLEQGRLFIFVLRSGEKEPVVIRHPVSTEQFLHLLKTYYREVVEYPQHGDLGQRWQDLAGPLLADVMPYLQGAGLVYLVPHGLLHFLPLHALKADGNYLVDHFPIAYATSVVMLEHVIQRAAARGTQALRRVLVVGNPTLDLDHTEDEARKVADLFGVHPLLGREATKVAVRSRLADQDLIHMACHGFFHNSEPLQSGVVLAGKRALSVQDLGAVSMQADLVALSACESGLGTMQETIGLPLAFLGAGASSVLGSLWQVSDESAGTLMVDFYTRLCDRAGCKVISKAVALRAAMLETRKRKEHPYYWAAFTLLGAWN